MALSRKATQNKLARIFILVVSLSLALSTGQAQSYPDSTGKLLLASVEKKSLSAASNTEAIANTGINVQFPEMLKGNEAQALPYIEEFCNGRRDYLVSMYEKGRDFLSKTAVILKKYNLPAELKILLALESAFDGNAVSRAGAVGYWQILDAVAAEYGMSYVAQRSAAEKKQHSGLNSKKAAKARDDRKNLVLATHTASKYLRDRGRILDNNWLLVVASYNCGIGAVKRAMKKSRKAKPSFWDIKKFLPAETRAYVMNFITLSVIFNNYELFSKKKLVFAPKKLELPVETATILSEAPANYSDR